MEVSKTVKLNEKKKINMNLAKAPVDKDSTISMFSPIKFSTPGHNVKFALSGRFLDHRN